MRSTALITTMTTLTLALAPVAPAFANESPISPADTSVEQSTEDTPTVTDRMIIKYHQPVPDAEQQQILEQAAEDSEVHEVAEAEPVRTTADEAVVVELPEAVEVADLEQAAEEIAADPAVAYAEPDRLVSVAAGATDTYFGSMWNLPTIGAPTAWDGYTGKGMTIGVVDTGFAPHADLSPNVIGGYDFISTTNLSNDNDGRDGNPVDSGSHSTQYGQCYYGSATNNSSWHGTHVAGTAAALRNNGGVVGVAPNATLLNARALGACGYGHESDIADAVRWLAGDTVGAAKAPAKRADVINLSLTVGGACSATMQGAFNTAAYRNIPVVVAAGNQGRNAANYAPANCQNVISVGASTTSGWLSSYSNWGDDVHVLAPGDSILSTADRGLSGPQEATYVRMSGTSMATPHVSGTVALMRQKNPTLTPARIKQIVLSTTNNTNGDPDYPVVSASKAVAATPTVPKVAAPAPAPTSYTTKGAIGSFYSRNQALTGSPTSHEIAMAGGVYQNFAKGTVYWSSATGTQFVKGGIRDAYNRNGKAAGSLGFPRSGEKSNGIGGAYQLFQKGKILWNSKTGSWALSGATEAAYSKAGNERGVLGYPTSDKKPNGIGGWYQTFQNGRILWSSTNGAHPITGQVSAAYTREGNERGSLGYPTSGEVSDGKGGTVQNFQKGRIVRSTAGGAHALKGSIAGRYDLTGGVSGSLGYPTSDEGRTSTGGAYQVFQKGRIYWSPTTYAQEIKGSIGSAYVAIGGTTSRLGFPKTGEVTRADKSVVQYFQGGTITWRPGGSIRIDYR